MSSFIQIFYDFTDSVTSIIENYGWYLLATFVALLYVYYKMKPTIDKFLQKWEDERYAAKYHKNPDLVIHRLNQQQSLIEKLQCKYNKDAEEFQKKVDEKDKRKREELLDKLSATNDGHRLGSSSTSSKSFKPEYNPLMGSGGTNYRAERKKPCSGGGCGR